MDSELNPVILSIYFLTSLTNGSSSFFEAASENIQRSVSGASSQLSNEFIRLTRFFSLYKQLQQQVRTFYSAYFLLVGIFNTGQFFIIYSCVESNTPLILLDLFNHLIFYGGQPCLQTTCS